VSIKRLAATTSVTTSLVLSLGVTAMWGAELFHGDNFAVGRHTLGGARGRTHQSGCLASDVGAGRSQRMADLSALSCFDGREGTG